MRVLETERLVLRWAGPADAEFMLELLNEPAFIRNIGNRGARTAEDAGRYIAERLVASYERNGFGLYVVELKETGEPVGICGLVRRESLDDVDVGFAFLERFWSRGYAVESATAVMDYAKGTLGLRRIVGITLPDNVASVRVLERIGLRFERRVRLTPDDDELMLYGTGA